ncbi:MAG: hypothetical protein CM1200mP15_04810 [Dehalococcoidia bacterium]|nr:MAG: hypothetical protein CM1200mP15_04810 [Dehalococcoidia bacterium]
MRKGLYIDSNDIKCVFWPSDDPNYMDNILEYLGEHVYLSVDLDVFDPSIMSAVGNPRARRDELARCYQFDQIYL